MQYYAAKLSEHIAETPEGYLICYDVPINRTGKQEYLPQEIGFDGGGIVEVERTPEEVFSKETLASFEGKPVTLGHPMESVNSGNYQIYAKGHAQNVRSDGETTIADLVIQDKPLIEEIKNGNLREISCGYICDFEEENGKIFQRKIRGNHIAIVPQGRAGSDVAIKDEKKKGDLKLEKKKKSIFKALSEMFDALPEGMEEQGLEQEEGAGAKDEMVEKAPKGDDLGSKLDAVLEKLGSIEERVSKLEGNSEKLSDEKTLDEYLEEMPEEESEKVKILKIMRPVIAGMEDACAKAKVTDALLSCFDSGNFGKILKDTESKAKELNDGKKIDFDSICALQKKEYDARNPHKKN